MYLIWVAFGLLFGSAANAIIDRLPRKESWLSGRSHCDKCKHELSWKDLIPVFSYLSLKGKCRYCHSPISTRNLIVELAMATGFALIGPMWLMLIIFWLTVIIAVMDWETMLVSELLVAIWGIVVILSHLSNLNDLSYLVGLAVGISLIGGIWLVSRGRAMGFGDVEIAAVMGFWLGWPNIFWAMEVAFVSGAAVGLLQILRHKNKLKGRIAFGTFLIIGSWVALCLNLKSLL